MLPTTLALVDDDEDYTEFLSQDLRQRGVEVTVFADSNDLLALDARHDFAFYVVDLSLPGIDGVNLIKVLRRRTQAGILVVSGLLAPEVFKDVIQAGADMYLAKPVQFEQVALAIEAVHRRVGGALVGQSPAAAWRLERRGGLLVAPDGVRIELSSTDLEVMSCFVEARGEVVSRDTLRRHLGHSDEPDDVASDALNATIYRLRRRIERATPLLVPLQSKSRVGYVFKAPLVAD